MAGLFILLLLRSLARASVASITNWRNCVPEHAMLISVTGRYLRVCATARGVVFLGLDEIVVAGSRFFERSIARVVGSAAAGRT